MIEASWDPDRNVAAAAGDRPPVAPPSAEDALVAELRQGDALAFERLYRRQLAATYGLALRLSCRAAEAEELTQEVFVRAWQARGSFQSFAHLTHWLRRVMVNEWINRVSRQQPLALDDSDEGPGAAALAAPAGPAGLAVDLERALAALSPRLRAVLLLFDLYGFDHGEIAELMGMTSGASKVQLHRARRRLRELMS